MSDFFLSLIPEDPAYVPPAEAQAQAVATLRARLPLPSHVEARVFDQVTFIDQGSNFEKVLCPACDEDMHVTAVIPPVGGSYGLRVRVPVL